MTPEEILQFLDAKTAAADAKWDQIAAVPVTLGNKAAIEAMFVELTAIMDEAKVVYDANVRLAYKHGYCVARNKYFIRMNKLQKQLNSLT